MNARVVHVPKADVTGLRSPRCLVCEYPLDHRCDRCGLLVCITKHCHGRACECPGTELTGEPR